jgi:TonB-linked SusC/RagA family outer membrane protein
MKLNAISGAMPKVWLPKKLLRVMKLTTLLLIVALMQASATGYSQKVSLTERNVPIAKVFQAIEKQTGYVFLYDNTLYKQRISIDVKNASIEEIINTHFNELPLTFSFVNGNNIVVKYKQESLADKVLKLFNQQDPIKGKITDELGKPIPGVTILNKTTGKGAIATSTGSYSIAANKGDLLAFSYIGYQSRKIYVGTEQTLNVSLEPETSSLDQVVVVGYGATRKKDLTGSVAIVNAADLKDAPFATIDNALAGKAAGVQVTKADGSPGGAVRIRIRGSSSLLGGNDPLYIIDGIPVQVTNNFITPGFDIGSPIGNEINGMGSMNSGLSTAFTNGLNSLGGLNVEDIESISILKDASSTAIYGSKAANGVVMITTKRGKKDMKPQISANYYATRSTPKLPKLLNADQYKMLLTESAQNLMMEADPDEDYIDENIDLILNHSDTFFGKANTDWLKEVTRNTISHNADLSVQGGGAASKYFSSISFNQTPGVIKSTDYQRVAGKLNLENEIGSKFRVITNVNMGYTDQNIGDGVYGQALRARPDLAPYDENGMPTSFVGRGGEDYRGFQNPVGLLQAINNAKTFSLLGSLSAIYNISKALEFKSTASLNMQTYNQRIYMPSFVLTGNYFGSTTEKSGIGSNANSRMANWFLENTLTYTKNIADIHDINVLAGTSYETRKNSFFSATASGYPNDRSLNNLSSAITPLFTRGDEPTGPQSYLLSFYLRANYTLLDKYLFTFTGRADGSSKFGPNNKFGYFPSAALGWRLSKENFLKDVKWIDDLKLRGSYGLTGSQNIGDQMYRTLYTPKAYAGANALIPTQLGNRNIKWESTKSTDIGLDVSLFDNRLQLSADYYDKRTNGALLYLPIAPNTSFGTLLSNTANLKNNGFEFTLQGDIIKNKDFRWNASLNVTWNKTIVTKLNSTASLRQIGNMTGLEYNNTLIAEGKPLGMIVGYTHQGIIKTQEQLDAYKKEIGPLQSILYPFLGIGDPMYQLDYEYFKSRNSALADAKTIIANAAPKYYGGFTQGFGYKNLDLQLYFTFSQGGKMLWGDHISSRQFSGTSNANAIMLDRYHPGNTETNRERLVLEGSMPMPSTIDVFSSSYIKLRTLTMNYRFNQSKWMQRTGLQNTSVFLSATNLFTLTKYPGNDPETTNDTYSVGGGYFDVSNYPILRTFSLGLKLGF